MKIKGNHKKCVVFIGIKKPEESTERIRYIGTGFFVSIPPKSAEISSKVPGSGFLYIVTAKHVAVKIGKMEAFIRVNLKAGKSLPIKVPNGNWFYHPDETWPSDVAVCPFLLENEIIKTLDYEAVHISTLIDDNLIQEGIVGEGDEVFTVGLFSRHTGSEMNLPIMRFGAIAMVPSERIHTSLFGDMEAYLVEARSIKGISGSPVFVLKPNVAMIGDVPILAASGSIYLLGLMHGHWDLEPGESIDVADDMGAKGGVNMGIAIVVPAKKISETLNCKTLVGWREEQEARWLEMK
jgi:hypothetical protein